jgi:hypothetical protein
MVRFPADIVVGGNLKGEPVDSFAVLVLLTEPC